MLVFFTLVFEVRREMMASFNAPRANFFFSQVWDSNSGQELFTLEGGTTSAVTYCCFKPTGSSIVGVSDTVVKV